MLAAPAPDDAACLATAALTAGTTGTVGIVGTVGTGGAHPAGTPGPYRVPRRLRRLIDVRAPRCEWPACGARAVRCDAEHDRAHPDGPTCACNLGPCCRRHHRIKQLGWTKTRSAHGVTWTSPGRGRSWLSPRQHPRPTAPTRALDPVPAPDPLDELSPCERDELLFADLDDPAAFELRAAETEQPATDDVLADLLRTGDTAWTVDLDDPYAWQDQPVDA